MLPGIRSLRLFQFTPLCEGRPTPELEDSRAARLFQFTPLCEGRLSSQRMALRAVEFQFTPLCEGRQNDLQPVQHCIAISIHAPV